MKRLLLIAYYFPPMGGGGVARPSKFVKYLARFGWSSSVLSTDAENYWLQDTSRLKDMPTETRVYRTSGLTGIGLLRKIFRPGRQDQKRSTTMMECLRKLTAWFLIPDSFVGWIPSALIRGCLICWRERIDVIVATAPPNSGALVGYLLSRMTGLPLVTDFRDLWVDEIHFAAPTAVHAALHEFLESRVVEASSVVLLTNPRAAASMKNRYGDPAKFVDVRTGYDPEDYASLPVPVRNRKTIRMIYTGNLTLNRPIRGLLEAMAQLQHSCELAPVELEVTFYGQRDDEKDRDVERYGLPNIFLKDNVGYEESLRLQADADILLFMGYNTNEKVRMVTSGKIYEYLYFCRHLGTPILAVSSAMDATDLLSGLPNCRVVGMEDVGAIKMALLDLVSIVRKGHLAAPDGTTSYSIEVNAKKLACLLDQTAKMKKQGYRS